LPEASPLSRILSLFHTFAALNCSGLTMGRIFLFLCVFALILRSHAQSYEPGYFITLDGKQVKGNIKFNSIQCGHLTPTGSGPGKIKVRPENENKAVEITADELRGFVMGLDSFVVMKNIPVSEKDYIKRDFVKVEVTGKLTLFIHCSRVPNGRYGSKIK